MPSYDPITILAKIAQLQGQRIDMHGQHTAAVSEFRHISLSVDLNRREPHGRVTPWSEQKIQAAEREFKRLSLELVANGAQLDYWMNLLKQHVHVPEDVDVYAEAVPTLNHHD